MSGFMSVRVSVISSGVKHLVGYVYVVNGSSLRPDLSFDCLTRLKCTSTIEKQPL